MLEQAYQEEAFFALRAAGGLTPPSSAQLYQQSIMLIQKLADELISLTPESVIYPASLADELSRIDAVVEVLTDSIPTIEKMVKLINEQSSLSALVRLQIGWDLYCRLYDVADGLPPAMTEAIADVTTPAALVELLRSISTEDIKQAFALLNNYLIASAPATPLPGSVVTEITQVIDTFISDVAPLDGLIATVQRDYFAAVNSLGLASSTFNDAVTVSLLDTLTNPPANSVSEAVKSVTPPAVISILENSKF